MPVEEPEASLVQNPAKSSSILPASPTPAGNLGVLPREIRDEIYGYVLGTTDPSELCRGFDVILALQIDSFGTTNLHWHKGYFPWILQPSKRIRQEAVEFLYSKGVFRVYGGHFSGTNTNNILDTDRITNVMLESGLTLYEKLEVTDLFAGTKVLRETFAEEFYFSRAEEQIWEPPMIEAVKQLIGFKTVTVLFFPDLRFLGQDDWDLGQDDWDLGQDDWDLGQDDWDLGQDDWDLGQDDWDTRFDALVHAFRRAAEPALGPSTEQSLELEGRPDDIAVVFHPRDYLSRKTQAAKEESENQKKTR